MVPLVTFITTYGFLIIKYPLKTFRAFVDFIQRFTGFRVGLGVQNLLCQKLLKKIKKIYKFISMLN